MDPIAPEPFFVGKPGFRSALSFDQTNSLIVSAETRKIMESIRHEILLQLMQDRNAHILFADTPNSLKLANELDRGEVFTDDMFNLFRRRERGDGTYTFFVIPDYAELYMGATRNMNWGGLTSLNNRFGSAREDFEIALDRLSRNEWADHDSEKIYLLAFSRGGFCDRYYDGKHSMLSVGSSSKSRVHGDHKICNGIQRMLPEHEANNAVYSVGKTGLEFEI